jgi:hypothetical protein
MPVLCLLLLGVFDLGRLYAEQVAVVSAAREGARAATYLSDEDAVKAIVVTEVNNTVALNPATDISVDRDFGLQVINVIVTYRHMLLFGLFEAWGNGGQLTVSATATMPMVRVFGGTPGPVNTPPPTGTPAPTDTPTATNTPTVTPTRTATPLVTNTPPAATNTPAPTNTPPAATNTPPAATNTPVPTNTPPAATNTPVPTNTPPAATNTPVPTNTPTVTLTATLTPTPCPLTVSVLYAQQATNNRKIYVQVRVVNACTGAPVTGATVTAAGQPSLTFSSASQAGNYNSCGLMPSGLITSITVNAVFGGQSGSGSGSVGNNNPTCQP